MSFCIEHLTVRLPLEAVTHVHFNTHIHIYIDRGREYDPIEKIECVVGVMAGQLYFRSATQGDISVRDNKKKDINRRS